MGRSPGGGKPLDRMAALTEKVDAWPAGERNEPRLAKARPGAQLMRGVFQKPFSNASQKLQCLRHPNTAARLFQIQLSLERSEASFAPIRIRSQRMSKPRRAALYLRVSTDDQSTALQRRELIQACKHRDWTVTEVYEDAGTSGAKGPKAALLSTACARTLRGGGLM